MNKGIVMDLSENSIIVMNPEGRFDKLPRGTRSCELGEEILYAPVKRRFRVPQMAIVSGLAAAIVLCFVMVSTLTGNVAGNGVVAYVTIDINPSVEIGIDNKEVVRDLHGLNTDGENLIASLVFKGKSLADVTSDILDMAEQGALAKGEGDIIISSTVVGDKTTINDEAIATKMKAQVDKHIEVSHPDQVKNYEVQAFAAPQEVRKEAQASGISAGKYAIYLNAIDNGVKVSLDDLKNESVHSIAKSNGGIQTIVKPDKPIDKSSLQRLLADEKSGKLTERMEQLQNEKSHADSTSNKDDDKNSNNSKSNSSSGKNQGKVTNKPTTTPTPRTNRNDNNNKNGNDDRNDGNDNNGKNGNSNNDKNNNDKNNTDKNNGNNKNNNDNKDDPKSTPKPDRKDDDDEGNGKKPIITKKPTATPKATSKPTVKPTSSSKPTIKPGFSWGFGKNDSDDQDKNEDRR